MIRIRHAHVTGPFTKHSYSCMYHNCKSKTLNSFGHCSKHGKPYLKYIVEKRTFYWWNDIADYNRLDDAEKFASEYGRNNVISVWHKDENGYFKFNRGETDV
jgi:hypothetical protein